MQAITERHRAREQQRAQEFEAGERLAARRTAALMALLANINRDPERHPEPYTAADFLAGEKRPRRPRRKPTSDLQAKAFFERLVRGGLAKEIAANDPDKDSLVQRTD